MKNRLPIILLAICVALFGLGLLHLFQLRYAAGDVYPEYSSLRADPLGTMALYESLAKLPGITEQRDFSAEGGLPDEKSVTYLHLAASSSDWTWMPEETVREIEGFLTRGGRLVVAFLPESGWLLGAGSGTVPPPGKKQSPKAKAEEERQLRRTWLTKRWGFEFSHLSAATNQAAGFAPVRVENQTAMPLPKTLAWHATVAFTNLDSSWHTIYARGTRAVLIERRFGPGSVVMATDCYYFSNEALAKDRQADLLAWFIGSGRRVYFDEAHLGVVETAGIATLMRKYRLQGLGASLLILGLLFVWKNSSSFVPPYPESEQLQPVLGQQSSAGFVNLLRRNIPSRDLLRVCFEEWTRSLFQGRPKPIARVDQAQAIFEAENARAKVERDPVRAYRQISEALAQPKDHQP